MRREMKWNRGLQGARPDEACVERRGQDSSSLLFAHACQQKPCVGFLASVQGTDVLNSCQALFVCTEGPCRRLTVVFALLQELRGNVKFSFIGSAIAESFSRSSQADHQRK
jgi:hypothetical protein